MCGESEDEEGALFGSSFMESSKHSNAYRDATPLSFSGAHKGPGEPGWGVPGYLGTR